MHDPKTKFNIIALELNEKKYEFKFEFASVALGFYEYVKTLKTGVI